MRSTPKVALTGVAFRPRLVRLVRLVRPFPQGAVWKFLSGIDQLGMAELLIPIRKRQRALECGSSRGDVQLLLFIRTGGAINFAPKPAAGQYSITAIPCPTLEMAVHADAFFGDGTWLEEWGPRPAVDEWYPRPTGGPNS